MPVYQGERYLAAAIESVLAQTWRDFELIIADNGSADGTEGIARRYAAADPRIRYERADANYGAAWNYNRLVGLARGEYFKWHAHDDLIAPTYIERAVEELDRDAGVALVYARARLIDEAGRPIGDIDDRMRLMQATPHERFGRFLASANMCNPIAGLMRIDALRRTRMIDRFRGSDYVLLSELALLGKVHEIPEPLFFRRMHNESFQRANPNIRAVQRWLDPFRPGAAYFPGLRLNFEFARSAWRMELAPMEKLACLWAARQWPKARLRDTLGRWKANVRGMMANLRTIR